MSSRKWPRFGVVVLVAALGAAGSCHEGEEAREREVEQSRRAMIPMALRAGGGGGGVGVIGGGPSDLTKAGTVVRGTCAAEIIDTRTFQPQIQITDATRGTGIVREVEDLLPPVDEEQENRGVVKGPRNGLVAGTTLDEARTVPDRLFPTIGATGWNPPDPTLAVGPNHVVVCVNMTVAFYSKTGTLQFSVPLSDAGNPGFFEPLGRGTSPLIPSASMTTSAGGL